MYGNQFLRLFAGNNPKKKELVERSSQCKVVDRKPTCDRIHIRTLLQAVTTIAKTHNPVTNLIKAILLEAIDVLRWPLLSRSKDVTLSKPYIHRNVIIGLYKIY